MEQSKYVPSFVLQCDDFVRLDEDGNEHHIHAGEWVRFRADLPWRLAKLADESTGYERFRQAIRVLMRQVLDWNWTGDDGQPLPKPGDDEFEDALWDLGGDERDWLANNCWEAANVPNE